MCFSWTAWGGAETEPPKHTAPRRNCFFFQRRGANISGTTALSSPLNVVGPKRIAVLNYRTQTAKQDPLVTQGRVAENETSMSSLLDSGLLHAELPSARLQLQ